MEAIIIDKIDKLKDDGYIVSSSLNCIAYVVYNCNAHVDIVENEDGFRLFCIEDNETNRKYLDEYKEQYTEIYVNLRTYNKIIKMLKNLCKNYCKRGVEHVEVV